MEVTLHNYNHAYNHTHTNKGVFMFNITDLIRKTADVLNHVQKHGRATVKGKGRPEFIIVEKSEYDELVSDRDYFMAESERLSKYELKA